MSIPEIEPLLSTDEARQVLGVSRPTFSRMLKRGDLPVVKVGRRTLIDPDDLRRYIAARKRRRGQNDDDPAATGSPVRDPADPGGGDGEA